MKKFAFLFVFIMIIPFVLVGCGKKEESLSCYAMDLEYNEENHTLSGNMVVDYINSSDNAFKELFFHLYPNAFREGAKARPYSNADSTAVFPNGNSYGDITINGVFYEGAPLEFEIGGEDLNLLKVNLPKELFPDERVKINIVFVTSLANINHRLGYGDNAVNFGNFYPIACVYENGTGFMTDVYSSNGDPFYSDTADYKVSITYPEKFTLASSGKTVKTTSKDGSKTASVEGKKIRDFCFVLSDKFEVASAKAGNVTVNYYHYSDADVQRNLKAACKAVETFGEMFGAYPYENLAVVQTNFIQGGMEYPNLVMISDKVALNQMPYVIVHEVAHQWWYGVVGSNQYCHAWQDEGLTDYSTMLFFREHEDYGENFEELVDGAAESYKLFVKIYSRITGSVDTSMERALDEFDTEPEYVACTYTKGALMFDTLRQTLGERKFFKALKDYYKNYSYKNASPADMIASFERSTGYELEGFFNTWLNGEVKVI